MSDPLPKTLTLQSSGLRAQIDPLGAQLSVLQDSAGRDLLWNGDPAIWAGRAPLLFPIVGALASGVYRLGTRRFALPRHGFARGKVFTVGEASATTATFRLSADESTLNVYPFRFELDVRYEVQEATLSVTTAVRNAGDVAMPASFGYHPGFRWPLPFGQPRAAHFIEFEADEPDPFRRLDPAGLLTPQEYSTPIVGRRWVLTDEMFKDDVVFFSRSVIYGADDAPRLQVSFPDSPYFGVWTKPGAPFICLEPWRGHADPQGFSGDFEDKPGVFSVAPGYAAIVTMALTLLEA
jgi:galactose mutarotase-like enzyme